MTSTIQATIPGFIAGTSTIDPVHSDVYVHRQAHDGQQGLRSLPYLLRHAGDKRGHYRDLRPCRNSPGVGQHQQRSKPCWISFTAE